MTDAVDHPQHYGGDTTYETIKVLESWDWYLAYGFCWGNAVKYLSRAGKKDPGKALEDLRKAAWYTDKAAEIWERNHQEPLPVDLGAAWLYRDGQKVWETDVRR